MVFYQFYLFHLSILLLFIIVVEVLIRLNRTFTITFYSFICILYVIVF